MTDLLFFLLELGCVLHPSPDCYTTRWKCAADAGIYRGIKRDEHRIIAACADGKKPEMVK